MGVLAPVYFDIIIRSENLIAHSSSQLIRHEWKQT